MANLFLSRVGAALSRAGYPVRRINFNAGDRLFWRGADATDFRGRPADWPDFFKAFVAHHGITDVVLFGDCRPLHQDAIGVAREAGLTIHVFEEGYLRPSWITYERGGVNSYSSLPRDAAEILALDATLPPPPAEGNYPSQFRLRAAQDVAYHLTRVAGSLRYRHYVPHAPIGAFREYADWLGLFCTRPFAQRRGKRVLAQLSAPFFLFPMQLDSDSQIRVHSSFRCMSKAIERIIASFADSAPPDTHLVIKRHPLDAGSINHARTIRVAAALAGVTARVHYIDHPDLDLLVGRARGVVTVNSTVGIRGLLLGRPVVTLGQAMYDIAGMTAQDGLEQFWTEQPKPDAALVAAYRRVLMRLCLLPGDYFSPDGLNAAVQHAVARMTGDRFDGTVTADLAASVRSMAARASPRPETVPVPSLAPTPAPAEFRAA